MTTRQPDHHEAEALDAITGPLGSRVRVCAAASLMTYEGTLRTRALTSDRTLDTLVIESAATGRRVSIRWAAVESLATIPEEPTP